MCISAKSVNYNDGRGAEGSVTLAVMWVYDNAAWAHIDAEKAINGAVSPVERLPLRWGEWRLAGRAESNGQNEEN